MGLLKRGAEKSVSARSLILAPFFQDGKRNRQENVTGQSRRAERSAYAAEA